MKTIKLSQNKLALVDDDDYDKLSYHKWSYSQGYAVRRNHSANKLILMHRVIFELQGFIIPEGYDPDHKDLDGLNNQRSNLRLATKSQQSMNTELREDNTSGYKGVYWHKQNRKWAAEITYEGKHISLGTHKSAEAAVRAYDCKAVELFGEFARLNFPGQYVLFD